MRPDSLSARLFVALQHVLPQHTVSRVVLVATRVRWRPFKNLLIRAFMRGFRPRMDDALEPDPLRYGSFNDFFTRPLKPGARPVAADPDIVTSPVDGTVSQIGRIDGQAIIQAKGRSYTLSALLADANPPGGESAGTWTRRFEGGHFATLYLAPYNYHRIHMPLPGRLAQAWFVPGRLFSVNATTAAAVDGLFARNERVLCAFEGATGTGPFAMALVGALNVGSIATVWHGDVAPSRQRRVTPVIPTTDTPLELDKGREMGRFNMGSTVILLFPPGAVQWLPDLGPGVPVSMGMPLAQVLSCALPQG